MHCQWERENGLGRRGLRFDSRLHLLGCSSDKKCSLEKSEIFFSILLILHSKNKDISYTHIDSIFKKKPPEIKNKFMASVSQ